jgi:hypothetical protein
MVPSYETCPHDERKKAQKKTIQRKSDAVKGEVRGEKRRR